MRHPGARRLPGRGVPIHFEGKNWRKYPEQWRDLLDLFHLAIRLSWHVIEKDSATASRYE